MAGQRGRDLSPPQVRIVPLSGGMDINVDSKVLKPPKVVTCQNAATRPGAVGNRPRLQQLAGDLLTNDSGPRSLNVFNGELLVTTPKGLYTKPLAAPTAAYQYRGDLPPSGLASTPLLSFGDFGRSKANKPDGSEGPYRLVSTNGPFNLSHCVATDGSNYGLIAFDTRPEFQDTTPYATTKYEIFSKVYLTLYNTVTGDVYWTVPCTGYLPSTGFEMLSYASGSSPQPTVDTSNTASNFRKAGDPRIVWHKGQFYVWFLVACQATTVDSGTTITGTHFMLPGFRLTPDRLQAPTPDTASSSVHNALSFVPYIATSGSQSVQTFAPIGYDVGVTPNGNDCHVVVNGQSYSSGTTAYRNNTMRIFANNAGGSSFTYPNSFAFVNSTPSRISLASSNTLCAIFTQGRVVGFQPLTISTLCANGAIANFTYNEAIVAAAALELPSTTTTNSYVYSNGQSAYLFSRSGTTVTPTVTNTIIADAATQGNSVYSRATAFSAPFNYKAQSSSTQPPITAQWLTLTNIAGSSEQALVPLNVNGNTVNNTPTRVLAHAHNNASIDTLIYNTATTTVSPRHIPVVQYDTPSQAYRTATFQITNRVEDIPTIRQLAVNGNDSLGTRPILNLPNGRLLLGANPMLYDGVTLKSHGYQQSPAQPVINATNTGPSQNNLVNYTGPGIGGKVAGAIYSYICVYADYDNKGNVIWSSPSPAGTFTATTSVYTAVIQPEMPSRGWLVIYRNSNANPGRYDRLAQLKAADLISITTLSPSQTLTNAWIDVYGDSVTNVPSLTFTLPGEQPNDPAPAATIGVSGLNRVWLVSADNPTRMYFSKPFNPGRQVEFNGDNFLDVDPPTGNITGLAIFDSSVVIFKRSRIFYLNGDGPDATGSGKFSNLLPIATDVGCTSAASVLVTQDGVWFQSQRGLLMLSRSLQVTAVAPEIQPIFTPATGADNIISTVICAHRNELRFGTTNGYVYVFDYLNQAWSIRTTAAAAPLYGQVSHSGITYGTYNSTATGLTVFYDDGTAGADSPAMTYLGLPAPAFSIKTPWLPISEYQQWGRLRRIALLGEVLSVSGSVTVQFAYDYNPSNTQVVNFTASQGDFSHRIRSPQQVCRAVQITISSTDIVWYLNSIALEILNKPGLARVGDDRSV